MVTCINDVGYQSATVELVATRAGVSRGAVQHHFGSRNDLLAAVVDDLGQALSFLELIPRELPIGERLDVAIDHDWKIFRSPLFVTVTQIWLAEQGNAQLFPLIRRLVSRVERQLDSRWIETFADVNIPPQQISTIRHVVLSSLRGLALRNLYRGDRAAWTNEIAMLKAMALQMLSGAPLRDPESRPTPNESGPKRSSPLNIKKTGRR